MDRHTGCAFYHKQLGCKSNKYCVCEQYFVLACIHVRPHFTQFRNKKGFNQYNKLIYMPFTALSIPPAQLKTHKKQKAEIPEIQLKKRRCNEQRRCHMASINHHPKVQVGLSSPTSNHQPPSPTGPFVPQQHRQVQLVWSL